MAITDVRHYYKPYEYQQAYTFLNSQQRAHWLPGEVSLSTDIGDWKMNLTESEQNLIGNILKSFAQTEVHVEDYWSAYVAKWFPKPEITGMAVTFAAFETIHAEAYSLLNESLGLDDFSEFLDDEAAREKIERLQDVKDENLSEIAQSLAIFSAFTEGVNLFSSFAILMSFQMRNLMKGMGQIVAWSVRDESLHSQAGIWLFNTLLLEHPELNTPELAKNIQSACEVSVDLEVNFIKKAFEMGDIAGLTQNQMINFIKARANGKMVEMGYNAIYNNIDPALLVQMEWFEHLTSGVEQQDFFAQLPSAYSKSDKDWEDV
jgi:ribonucleoside-diphosphate reductase beta chain